MSKDKRKNYFDENFFNDDDLESKENTADFKHNDDLSHRSKEQSGEKNVNGKFKGTNYIQNYKNSYKNTGYTELLKKKKPPFNYINNTPNSKGNNQEYLTGLNTINYEAFIQDNNTNDQREHSYSPAQHKLVDALQNIDKNLFVKITKKENKKIDNFPIRRASNFREKTKNSLTSLGNILNSNQSSTNNIIVVTNTNTDNTTDKEKSTKSNNNDNNSTPPISNKSKIYQRNKNNNASQQQKQYENISENNNETTDEIVMKNSRNLSQQTSVMKESNSKLADRNIYQPNNMSKASKNNSMTMDSNVTDNVYKRPTRNHNRELSQEVNDMKNSSMYKTADLEVGNYKGQSARNIKELVNKSNNKLESNEYMLESNKNLENINSNSSLLKNTKASPQIHENKLEISTITDNPRNNQINLPFIYDESIKDHASEEKEINVDSLIHINKRFLEIMKTQTEEKVSLKSMIPISLACKISNEILSEMKSEADKDIFELLSKNKDLVDKNNELKKENTLYKESLFKTTASNNNEKSLMEMSSTIRDLQKYILKLEKENVVLKNEFINNIKNKNGMVKKFNDDLNDYQRITNTFLEKYSQLSRTSEQAE
jgi:hypothetical protein